MHSVELLFSELLSAVLYTDAVFQVASPPVSISPWYCTLWWIVRARCLQLLVRAALKDSLEGGGRKKQISCVMEKWSLFHIAASRMIVHKNVRACRNSRVISHLKIGFCCLLVEVSVVSSLFSLTSTPNSAAGAQASPQGGFIGIALSLIGLSVRDPIYLRCLITELISDHAFRLVLGISTRANL